MANITYRVNSNPAIPGTSIVKGAPLTNVEVDANFRAIDIEVDQLNSSTVRLTGDQTIGGVKTFSQPPRWGADGSRGITLAVGTDLNTITDAGWYDVSTTVNAPAETTHGVIHLIVSRGHSPSFVLQTAADFHSDRIWFRRSIGAGGGAVWQPWVEMLHRGNGVALSGDQAIAGIKTFSSPLVASSINFTPTLGQKLTFWSTPLYGIGLQISTVYTRSSGRFSWYRNGVHADAQNDAGGGIVAMTLDQSSNLTVGGAFFGAGTGLTGTAAGLNIGGNAATVTDGVTISGTQTITGAKTFSQPIVGATNSQVSLTGDQTIAGVKTFSQPPRWGADGSRGITLAPGTNLNTITDAGWYDVNTHVNAPAGASDWIHLTVSRGHNARWVLQTVADFHSDRVWFRRSQDMGGVATWQPWVEMLHRGNGVALSGNQTIGGVKTFSSRVNANNGINVIGNVDVSGVTNALGGRYTTASASVAMYEMHLPGLAATAWRLQANGTTDLVVTHGDGVPRGTLLSVTSAGALHVPGGITVPNDSFSFAQLQNIPTATILGRSSAGTGDVEALTGAQATTIFGGLPAGAVAYFAMNSPPTGWVRANGAAVSRATFAALFAAIGTTYGAGDGSTTFNLPDLRGEFIRGLDDGRGVDAGRNLGSAQAHQMQSHDHAMRVLGSGGGSSAVTTAFQSATTLTTGFLASAGGTSNGSENRPRNVAMLACIKF